MKENINFTGIESSMRYSKEKFDKTFKDLVDSSSDKEKMKKNLKDLFSYYDYISNSANLIKTRIREDLENYGNT